MSTCVARSSIGRVSTLLVAAALGGCTLGPEPDRPATAADGARPFVHANDARPGAGATTADVSAWWRGFGDPVTAELVERALEHNTDLKAAAARVLEAEASLARATGSRVPQVDVSLRTSRQKSSVVLPNVGRTSVSSTTYSDELSVSYVLDLFGKLKRTRQSAWASLLAEEAAAETVVHGVVAQVVRARVRVAILERTAAIAETIASSWERTLATTERRYRSGLVTAVDLYLARENLSSAEAAQAEIAGNLAQARHGLDVLVGRRPGTGDPLPATLPELPDLGPVPVGLPADLLDRRPDLRQAEARLAASTYGVGAALADLYPSLSLTGSVGASSDELVNLVESDALIYSAVAGLVAPLFSGGQRRADVVAARARADQAAAEYAGTVLNALREVEDALVASATAVERRRLTERRVGEARAADRLARDRYQRGVDSLLKVLETERRLRSAEEALLVTTSDLWTTRIDLYLALGGDWSAEVPDSPQNSSSPARNSMQPVIGKSS
jgi:multidrug efflux system outer membrane protein